MIELLYYSNTITDWLFTGYCLTALPLILAGWSGKRKHADELMATSLTILLIASCVFIPLMVYNFLQTAYLIRKFDNPAFGYLYWFMMALRISPQLCWIKKYRHSYSTALLLFLLCGAGFVVEPLVIYLTRVYQNSLPSSWSYGTPHFGVLLLSALSYSFLLFLVPRLRRRLRKQVFTD